MFNYLSAIVFLPVIGAIIIALIPASKEKTIKYAGGGLYLRSDGAVLRYFRSVRPFTAGGFQLSRKYRLDSGY